MKSRQGFILICIIGFIFGLIALMYFGLISGGHQMQSGQAHANQSMYSSMRALGHCIDTTAILERTFFGEFVGRGIVINIIDFDPILKRHFPHDTNQVTRLYWDIWDNPYLVSILPTPSTNSRVVAYQIKIWSKGPNGRDERGLGDDIQIDWPTLEIAE
jgi:hypothetical protein